MNGQTFHNNIDELGILINSVDPATHRRQEPPLGVLKEVIKDKQYMPYVNYYGIQVAENNSHQVWHRCAGGDAGLWQLSFVHKRRGAFNGSGPIESSAQYGGNQWPTATGWSTFPAVPGNQGVYSYEVSGQYHENDSWHWDAAILFRKERWTNGYKYRLAFEDKDIDGDNNDHIIELALIWLYRPASIRVEGKPHFESLPPIESP